MAQAYKMNSKLLLHEQCQKDGVKMPTYTYECSEVDNKLKWKCTIHCAYGVAVSTGENKVTASNSAAKQVLALAGGAKGAESRHIAGSTTRMSSESPTETIGKLCSKLYDAAIVPPIAPVLPVSLAMPPPSAIMQQTMAPPGAIMHTSAAQQINIPQIIVTDYAADGSICPMTQLDSGTFSPPKVLCIVFCDAMCATSQGGALDNAFAMINLNEAQYVLFQYNCDVVRLAIELKYLMYTGDKQTCRINKCNLVTYPTLSAIYHAMNFATDPSKKVLLIGATKEDARVMCHVLRLSHIDVAAV